MAVKILAVDDEPEILRLVKVKLEMSGFEVVTARDGEEGVRIALAEKPDIVLLDLTMPKLGGYAAAQRIKAEVTPQPIILMLTGRAPGAEVTSAMISSVDGYIAKPFSPRELVAEINVALTKAGKSPDSAVG
jgi:two-component system alkaline phosphatase synthesis response regulator PhoP